MLAAIWSNVLSGFWFVPGAVASAYVALAVALVRVDRAVGPRGVTVAFDGDADAARGILSTIAGSLITVAGLAFSLTIVVLSLVSSQFTPRAVRGLLADRVNQVVAGSFVGVFAYCLVVLRSVRAADTDEEPFIPGLSVAASIALGLVSLGLLLVFIHHTGTMVRASDIASRIGRATVAAIDRLYPETFGAADEQAAGLLVTAWRAEREPHSIRSERPGYVRDIAVEDLAEAVGESARVHIAVTPGDFVTGETTVLEVWRRHPFAANEERSVRRALSVENERDLRQDAAFGARQLTDMAMRALSPGINDPTTADTCVRYLGACLERLAGRRFPVEVRSWRSRGVTVVARRRNFDDYLDATYLEIGRFAADNARVVVVLLETLLPVVHAAVAVGAHERLPVLRETASAISELGLNRARVERDRLSIESALTAIYDACART